MRRVDYHEIAKRSADLPDDAAVPEHAAAILRGISIWTYRRNPAIRRIKLSENRYGERLGDIRRHNRGELAASPA